MYLVPPGGTKVGWLPAVTVEGGGTEGGRGGIGDDGEGRGEGVDERFFIRGKV